MLMIQWQLSNRYMFYVWKFPSGRIPDSSLPSPSFWGQKRYQVPRFGPHWLHAGCRVLEPHLLQGMQNSRASISGLSSAPRLGFFDYFEILPFITCNFRKEGKALILSNVSFLAYATVFFSFATHEKPEQKVTSF